MATIAKRFSMMDDLTNKPTVDFTTISNNDIYNAAKTDPMAITQSLLALIAGGKLDLKAIADKLKSNALANISRLASDKLSSLLKMLNIDPKLLDGLGAELIKALQSGDAEGLLYNLFSQLSKDTKLSILDKIGLDISTGPCSATSTEKQDIDALLNALTNGTIFQTPNTQAAGYALAGTVAAAYDQCYTGVFGILQSLVSDPKIADTAAGKLIALFISDGNIAGIIDVASTPSAIYAGNSYTNVAWSITSSVKIPSATKDKDLITLSGNLDAAISSLDPYWKTQGSRLSMRNFSLHNGSYMLLMEARAKAASVTKTPDGSQLLTDAQWEYGALATGYGTSSLKAALMKEFSTNHLYIV